MANITLDQVLDLATRLAPADQARLIARLAPQIEQVLVATQPNLPDTTEEDPWDTLARIGAELSAMGPVIPSATDDLIASRR